MTPDQIKTAVTRAGARVDVPLSALTGVSALFASFFPAGRFTLDAVTDRTETTGGVTVAGTGASGPFTGMQVTAVFTGTPDGVTVVVTATADSAWTFTQAFPPLAHTVFDTLHFQSPTLILDSTAQQMAFTGTLIISTAMAPLDLLMPNTTHTITGVITMVSGPPELGFTTTPVPDILLYGPENHSVDVGLFTLSSLRYEIMSDPFFNYDRIDWMVLCSVVVTAAIPITVSGQQRQVLVSAFLSGWGDRLLFSGDFSALGDLAFAEIVAFTRQQGLPIPFDVTVTNPVKLTEVQLMVSPARLSVDYVSVKLETRESWTIVQDLFTLDAVDLYFRIDRPLSSPSLTGILGGLFGIGNSGTLEVSADFGARTLSAALRQDDGPLSIREVYSDFTGAEAAPVPDLSVQKFDLGLTLPSGTAGVAYHAFLELVGRWQLTTGLALTDVMFAIDHGTDTRFQALAIFTIAGVDLKIAAQYDPAPDKQWMFSGETGPGQQIPIGALFQDLANHTGQITLPAPIARLVLLNLGMSVTTGSRRLFLTGTAMFPIDTAKVALTLAIDTAARSLAASLAVTVPTPTGPFTPTFALVFAAQATDKIFIASYTHGPDDPIPTIKDLVAAISPSAAAAVPDGIRIDLRDAFLAVDGSAVVFGVDLTATIDLSKLPVLGDRLKGGTWGFDPLRLGAASANLTAAQVKAVDGLLPASITKLPADQDLAAGFLIEGVLKLGALERPLRLPVKEGPQPPAPTSSKDVQTADNALWYKVQRSFGPIRIARVGIAYQREPGQSAQLAFLLDASLTVAGLTLSASGLSAGLALSDPAAGPTFDLSGLGLSYVAGPVSISGAFLKSNVKFQGATYRCYSGLATIVTPTLTIGAMGSYMQLPQGPSLFGYAFLNYPAGIGPAFLRLTGVAAGFGYNRRLIVPPVSELADFPPVIDAISGPPPGTDLPGQLARLNTALPPSPGDIFLMFGLRAVLLEMIDAFALLVLAFGNRFELHLMGMATVVLPATDAAQPGATPIAEVQIAMLGSFVPGDGLLSVSAQLTENSFLLSRDCHLVGGFAATTWFAGPHAGDFVVTVGGYHPHFTVPAHYPNAPRLGFHWQVTEQLQLRGGAYFALTPSCLMAGGDLSATWQDGSLRAWFDASADFLIGWQPFHYEVSLHISLGASYTFTLFGTHTIGFEVGADLHIWGPDFSGTASIHLFVISFSIAFGAAANPRPKPVDWARFQSTLLPPADKITTITVESGTLAAGTGSDLGVLDPHNLVLVTDSSIPSSTGSRGPQSGGTDLPALGKAFGIGPMDVAATTTSHRIEITQGGRRVDDLFVYETVGKSLPYALWGGNLAPSTSSPQLIDGLLTGYRLRPKPPVEPAGAPALPDSALKTTTPLFTERAAIAFTAPQEFAQSAEADAARAAAITRRLGDATTASTRSAIVDAVLKGATVDLAGFTTDQFLETPQVVAHG